MKQAWWEYPKTAPHLLVMPQGWWGLTDGRVVLSPIQERDVKGLATSVNDPAAIEMLRHWHDFTARTAGLRQHEIRQALMDPWYQHDYRFTVFAQGKIVGARWLTHKPGGAASCGGWVHPAMRRRGIGSAALMLALHFYARSLGGRAVATGTRPDNLRAQANLAACGFAHTEDETDDTGLTLQIWERELYDLRELGDMPVNSAAGTQPGRTHIPSIMGKNAR